MPNASTDSASSPSTAPPPRPVTVPNISHNRAWFIGGLYVVSAALPSLQAAFASGKPINWPLVACEMAVPAAATLRGFLDGTIEQLRAQRSAREGAAIPTDTGDQVLTLTVPVNQPAADSTSNSAGVDSPDGPGPVDSPDGGAA